MFNIGFTEMLVLGILALLLIGPKQLPELARTLGRFLNDLKRSTSSLTDDIKRSTSFDNIAKPNPPPAPEESAEKNSHESNQS